jgi:phospholipid/cholesterol/gamma-HCH transport system substrate-binding protein
MGGRPVTLRELAALMAFVLLSGGAILAAWLILGGTVPLQAKGYRVTVGFPSARTLVAGADVRIAGVPVGKVVRARAGEQTTEAVLELKRKYAPLPRDAHALVRTKTPLGESYVAISRGTPSAPPIPDGGRLASTNVVPAQQIEDVLDAFDPPTRRALRTALGDAAAALDGRGTDLNQALGATGPAAESIGTVLTALDAQRADVQRLVDRTGAALAAVAQRPRQLQRLVRAGDALFATTADRSAKVTATVDQLARFAREAHATDTPLRAVLAAAAPTVRALRPVAPLLAPTLRDVDALAPRAQRLATDLRPVLRAAGRALPPATRLLKTVKPLGTALDQAGRQLIPVLQLVSAYRHDIAEGLPSFAAALQATHGGGRLLHYARQAILVTTEGDLGYKRREPSNRSNAYPAPGRALEPTSFSCADATNPVTLPAAGPQLPCAAAQPWTFRGRTRSFPSLTPYAPHR